MKQKEAVKFQTEKVRHFEEENKKLQDPKELQIKELISVQESKKLKEEQISKLEDEIKQLKQQYNVASLKKKIVQLQEKIVGLETQHRDTVKSKDTELSQIPDLKSLVQNLHRQVNDKEKELKSTQSKLAERKNPSCSK